MAGVGAKILAQAFIDLLKHDKPFAAHQLTRNAATRKPFAVEEPDPYAKDADTKKDYDAFLKLDAVEFLLAEKDRRSKAPFGELCDGGRTERHRCRNVSAIGPIERNQADGSANVPRVHLGLRHANRTMASHYAGVSAP